MLDLWSTLLLVVDDPNFMLHINVKETDQHINH